jgi:uncharacterized protein YjeT (DUF2065 family)
VYGLCRIYVLEGIGHIYVLEGIGHIYVLEGIGHIYVSYQARRLSSHVKTHIYMTAHSPGLIRHIYT